MKGLGILRRSLWQVCVLLRRLSFLLALLASAALVFVLSYQVLARYLFNSGSVALGELSWHLFATIFVCGLGETLARGGHVSVDIIAHSWSKERQRRVHALGSILFLLPLALFLLVYGWSFVQTAFAYHNPRALDYWSRDLWSKSSMIYQWFSPLEAWFRHWFLPGEISGDPDGLEARYLVKALLPWAGVLLLAYFVEFWLGPDSLADRDSGKSGKAEPRSDRR